MGRDALAEAGPHPVTGPFELAFADPVLTSRAQLAALEAELREAGVRRVLVLGNPIQAEFLASRGFAVDCPGDGGWPVEERYPVEADLIGWLEAERQQGRTGLRATSAGGPVELDLVPLILGEILLLRVHIAIAGLLGAWGQQSGAGEAILVVSARDDFGGAVHAYAGLKWSGSAVVRAPSASALDRPPAKPAVPDRLTAVVAETTGVLRHRLRGEPLVFAPPHRQVLPVLAHLREDAGVRVAGGAATALARRLAARVRKAEPGPGVREAVQVLDGLAARAAGAFTGVRRDALLLFLAACRQRVRDAVTRSRIELSVLDWIDPDVVMTSYWAGYPAHAQLAWCRARGRNFSVVQHGFHLGSTLTTDTPTIEADTFYCWGEEYRDRWVPADADIGQVLPLGNPLYDSVCGDVAHPPVTEPTVLVTPSATREYFNDAYLAFWEQVFALVESQEGRGFRWLFRVHNLCAYRPYIAEAAARLGVAFSEREESFLGAVQRSDIVISTVSTAVADAMYARRPTLVVGGLGEPELFSHYRAGIHLGHVREAGPVLRRLADDPAFRGEVLAGQQSYVDKFCRPGAAERIASHLARALTGHGLRRTAGNAPVDALAPRG